MSDLFLFLDEAGDFTFNLQASKYLVFTCLSSAQPAAIADALTTLRYDSYAQGFLLERFHAAEDKQAVRNKVFAILSTNTGYELDAVVVEKRKTYPSLQSFRLYSRIYRILLKYVLRRQNLVQLNSVQVICDTVPVKQKRKAMEGALKMEIAALLRGQQKLHNVVFHSSRSHPFLQGADYCGWAIFRKWERGDLRSYALISPKIKSEFNVFAIGSTFYY
jgi:hypothetical protein